jgi:hypothetical protein
VAASRNVSGWPADIISGHDHIEVHRKGRPSPRAWRQRTRIGDVARHEEAGMRARMVSSRAGHATRALRHAKLEPQ